MTGCSRPLAGAAIILILTGGMATAQTVVIRHAPPGETIEAFINATPAGSATVDANGDGVAHTTMMEAIGKTEIDANIAVDTCQDRHRVFVIESGRQAPPPDEGCVRREVVGLLWVRRVNTIVVDVAGLAPTVRLIVGSFSLLPPAPPPTAPSGLVVFGAAGFGKLSNAALVACGLVEPCTKDERGMAYNAGATLWISKFLGAHISYMRPANVKTEGSGTGFRFNSSLRSQMLTVAAAIGAPVRRVRLFSHIGLNYHQAITTTTQTVDDIKVTVGDVTQTIPGGRQVIALETRGWGWIFGGGVETWVRSSWAIYGEAGLGALKGKAVKNAEGVIDDKLTFFIAGVKVHLFH